MTAADNLLELYNKASSDRDKCKKLQNAQKLKGDQVINPFSPTGKTKIKFGGDLHKRLKKLCEAHEEKKEQIEHLHVPKAKGVKEESSSDSEQSGDDETQPDDDRKDPHLILPNVF